MQRRSAKSQFYIQLVYEPHFGTKFPLLGRFGQLKINTGWAGCYDVSNFRFVNSPTVN